METTTYCNPFAESFGNPLMKDESTHRVNSFLAANKDAYGFSTKSFTTIRGTILAESPHLNVFFDNRSARVYTNFQSAEIKSVRFYDTMDAYVTRVGDSDGTSNLQDKVKFYYDSTVTKTPPPEIIKYGAFPQSAIDGQIPLEFTYTFDSLVAPTGLPANQYSGLIITSSSDSTEELPIAVINPTNLSGTISNYIPTSPNIKIRSVTEEEWGSTVYGCEAILDSISIQATPSGTFVMTERYGSLFSYNSNLPYVSAFNSALRIKSVDNA